jgi:hypothetical protein
MRQGAHIGALRVENLKAHLQRRGSGQVMLRQRGGADEADGLRARNRPLR